MKFILASIVSLFSAAAPAQVISLHPGETITVRFDSKPVVERTGRAEPASKFEMYLIWRAQTQAVPPAAKVMPPSFGLEGEGPPNPPHPSDDRLHLTLRRVPSIRAGSPDTTVLLIANGYGSMLHYHALMRSGDRSRATDVCDAVPHLLGIEYWPYVIDELDLSDLQLTNWSGSVQCQ